MLRSRGAGPFRIAEMAAIEGLVLVAVAVIIGPWLALAALHLFDVVGPLADIGLGLESGCRRGRVSGGRWGRPAVPRRADAARVPVGAIAGRRAGRARSRTDPEHRAAPRSRPCAAGGRSDRPVPAPPVRRAADRVGQGHRRRRSAPDRDARDRTPGRRDRRAPADPVRGARPGARHAALARARSVAQRAPGRPTPAALHARGAVAHAGDVHGRLRGLVRGDLDDVAGRPGPLPGRRRCAGRTQPADRRDPGLGARSRLRRDRRGHCAQPGLPRHCRAPDRLHGARRDRRRGRAGRRHAAARPRRDLAGRHVRATGRGPPGDGGEPAAGRADVRSGSRSASISGPSPAPTAPILRWSPRRSRLARDHGVGGGPRRTRVAPSVRCVAGSAVRHGTRRHPARGGHRQRDAVRVSAGSRRDRGRAEPSGGIQLERRDHRGGGRRCRPDGTWSPVDLELASGWRATTAFFGQPHRLAVARTRGDALAVYAGTPGLAVIPGADDLGPGTDRVLRAGGAVDGGPGGDARRRHRRIPRRHGTSGGRHPVRHRRRCLASRPAGRGRAGRSPPRTRPSRRSSWICRHCRSSNSRAATPSA